MGTITEWGSTAAERAGSFACDRYVDRPNLVCFRAVSVAAPASRLWTWLCQLRVAPYSYDWIDNFGRRSPTTRDPANLDVAVGQPVMRIFTLAELELERHLTIRLTKTKAFGDLAVTYAIRPEAREPPDGRDACRLVVKLVSRLPRASPMRAILPAGDLVMMRKQLLTLKRLAEASA